MVVVLFWSECAHAWKLRQQMLWDDRYLAAVRSDRDDWRFGWRLEELEARPPLSRRCPPPQSRRRPHERVSFFMLIVKKKRFCPPPVFRAALSSDQLMSKQRRICRRPVGVLPTKKNVVALTRAPRLCSRLFCLGSRRFRLGSRPFSSRLAPFFVSAREARLHTQAHWAHGLLSLLGSDDAGSGLWGVLGGEGGGGAHHDDTAKAAKAASLSARLGTDDVGTMGGGDDPDGERRMLAEVRHATVPRQRWRGSLNHHSDSPSCCRVLSPEALLRHQEDGGAAVTLECSARPGRRVQVGRPSAAIAPRDGDIDRSREIDRETRSSSSERAERTRSRANPTTGVPRLDGSSPSPTAARALSVRGRWGCVCCVSALACARVRRHCATEVGPDDFRDFASDACHIFSSLPEGDPLGPHALWEIVPLDGDEGAVGLRAFSNGLFLRVKVCGRARRVQSRAASRVCDRSSCSSRPEPSDCDRSSDSSGLGGSAKPSTARWQTRRRASLRAKTGERGRGARSRCAEGVPMRRRRETRERNFAERQLSGG